VISLASSGYDWVDMATASRQGIVVTYAPLDSLAEVVADLTWGLLLSVARQIPEHHFRLQKGDAARGMGTMVAGRTLGVVGLGNVGRKVACRADGFNMKVIATDTHPNLEFCEKYNIQIVPLDDLLRQADFVSLHLRLDSMTEGIIGQRELRLMKPTAYLINTGRWGLVDEAALAQAVLDGAIAGVAADDPPLGAAKSLLSLPNAVFTPHIGNRVLENVNAVCRQAYENALDVVLGRKPNARYVLNPETLSISPRLSSPGQAGCSTPVA
jgi:phosphoglycerate dehydrogenase-like enzyme